MKTNLTLCFYEYPGALQEIKQWENLKFDSIIEKEVPPILKTRYYKVKLDKEKCEGFECEILKCFPIIDSRLMVCKEDIEYSIKRHFGNEKIVYYKTIIFGKVNSNNLNEIKNIVEHFESNYK